MPTVDTSIKVALGDRSYEIVVGRNLLDDLGRRLLALGYSGKVGVVTDKNVGRLFAARVMRSLKSAGLIAHLTIIPAGERTKRLRWVGRVLNDLVERRFERSSVLIGLGGGVIGDLTGFRRPSIFEVFPSFKCRPPLSRKWIPASAVKLGSIIQWAKT